MGKSSQYGKDKNSDMKNISFKPLWDVKSINPGCFLACTCAREWHLRLEGSTYKDKLGHRPHVGWLWKAERIQLCESEPGQSPFAVTRGHQSLVLSRQFCSLRETLCLQHGIPAAISVVRDTIAAGAGKDKSKWQLAYGSQESSLTSTHQMHPVTFSRALY